MLKPRLIKKADFEAMEQERIAREQSLQQQRTLRSSLVLQRRNFILGKRELNANAKQQFHLLFATGGANENHN